MSRASLVLGIDIGTTGAKAAAYSLDGTLVTQDRILTPWDVSRHGEADIDLDVLADACIGLLDSVATACADDATLIAIGITGLAETGVVVDHAGSPRHRGIAWFDQRGAGELGALPSDIERSFTGVTGLALKAECSLAKLLWLKGQGLVIGGNDMWLNAQEYVAFRLTGNRASERSLTSRTALWDQGTGDAWGAALELIGASGEFIPPFQGAGEVFGHVQGKVPDRLRGLPVTVAGHDHLVAAVGSGAVGSNQLFNSCGTADVLVRSVPWHLDTQARVNLVAGGLSAGMHVVPGRTAILGATRFGLVLERVLTAVGATSRREREELTNHWDPAIPRHRSVVVSEPPNWTNEVTIGLKDAADREQVVTAAIDYGVETMRPLIRLMSHELGSFDDAVAGGGWVQLAGVRRAKESLLPRLALSPTEQPGIRGAAMLAAVCAGSTEDPLTRELSSQLTPSIQREINQ